MSQSPKVGAPNDTRTSSRLVLTWRPLSFQLIFDSLYFLVILLLQVHPPWGEGAYAYLYPSAHYFFNMSVCVTAWLTVSVAVERYIMVSISKSSAKCHSTYEGSFYCEALLVSCSSISVVR